MFKYVGIMFLLKSIVSEDLDYKYDDYGVDQGLSSSEEEVYNVTRKSRPNRVDDHFISDIVENIIENSESSGFHYTLTETSHEAATTSPVPLPRRVHTQHETTGSPSPDPKDNITTYPFAASVLRRGSHYATGALVGRRWVLTSGGAFYNVRESIKLFRVRLGSVDCKKGGTLLAIQRIAVHPAYVPGKPESDLAMLRLSEPAPLSALVRPVSLTQHKGKVDLGKFLTMYWPRIIVNGKPLPSSAKERTQHSNLRVSSQRLIPWKQCLRDLSYRLAGLSQDNFCLRPLRQHHTTCLPDVGAPVVSADGLWGVVSGWVTRPCAAAAPGPVLVARVAPPAARYWIQAQMED